MPATYEEIAKTYLDQAGHVGRAISEVTTLAQNQILKPGTIESLEWQVMNVADSTVHVVAEFRDAQVADAVREYHQAPDPRPAAERTADEAKLARLIAAAPTKREAQRYMDRANRAESVGAYQEALVYAQAAEAKGVLGSESLVNFLSSMLDMTVPERRAAKARQNAAISGAIVLHRAVQQERTAQLKNVLEAYKAANDYRGVTRVTRLISEASMSAKISAFIEAQETGKPYVEPSMATIWQVAGRNGGR